MPILRGSLRSVSTAKENDSEQTETRKTRSSKSPAVCASLRLKEFKTSNKLTRAEIRSSAAARLTQRNKKKSEKEAEASKDQRIDEIKTVDKSRTSASTKKSSPTKSSKISVDEGIKSNKSDVLLEKDQDEEEDHENGEKLSKSSEQSSVSTSSKGPSDSKDDSRRKRKQSLEIKAEAQRKRQKTTFYEYVLEPVPSKKPRREEENLEQVEEKMDTESGGRRRSKRGSVPNTQYSKNFIDPSKRIPKYSRQKKSTEKAKKTCEIETRPSPHQDKVEVIKCEMEEISEISNDGMETESRISTLQQEKQATAEQRENEDEGSKSSSEAIHVNEEEPPNTTDKPESCDTENSTCTLDEDGTTMQAKSGEVTRSTETQEEEEMSSNEMRKDDTSTNLQITELPVVYVNKLLHSEKRPMHDNTKVRNQKPEQLEKGSRSDWEDVTEVLIVNPPNQCIEIQGVTEEVIAPAISDVGVAYAEIMNIGSRYLPRERPGRICKQEVDLVEEEGNILTRNETQGNNFSTVGTSKTGPEMEEGVEGSQKTMNAAIVNPKGKRESVETLDISVQADDLSESDDQEESSMNPLENNSGMDMVLSVKSFEEIPKTSTIIKMPDGRSLSVSSSYKAGFDLRTLPKTISAKQSTSLLNADVKRITLPSGATGVKILNATPEMLNKLKPPHVSTDGEAPAQDTTTNAGEAVPKSHPIWNAVYKSQGIGTDNQEVIVVSLPEGQEVKRTFSVEQKKQEEVAYEINADGKFVCGVCDYKTNRKSNWYKHRKKHMGQKSHKCEYCNYVAATSSNLKRHQNIHLDVREHQCIQCGQTFRQKIHLERHIKYKHEEKSVKCPLCDYVCANENPDLKVHIKRRHVPQEDDESKEAKSYTCSECGLMTYSKKDMRQHMKFHKNGPELKLFCEQCSFVTDCESRLKRHMLIHSHERPFQCGLCDYRGSQKEHVLRHMKTQHHIVVEKKNKKGLDMEDSDSKDSSTVDKQNDKSDYSSLEKIFACNHCSMKFSKLINLYKHLHVQHKEVLPHESEEFLCVVCDFRTSSKKNLLVHMRKHNLQDQVPPSHVYSCVLCRYMNPRRRNLFQHMKKKHGIEIVIRDDGSTSCFVTDSLPANEDTINNMLTVGDIVTTASEDAPQLQIITDEPNSTQNVISIEDLAYAVSHPKPNTQVMKESIVKPRIATVVKEHEAAEAIEGLQALAGQPGIAHFHLDPHKQDNMETEVITMETPGEFVEERDVEKESGYQVATDQLMNLSTGDFVEINGEMYKVEISSEDNSEPAQESSPAHLAQVETGLSEIPGNGSSQLELINLNNNQTEASLVKDSHLSNNQTEASLVKDSHLNNNQTEASLVKDSQLSNNQTEASLVKDPHLNNNQTEASLAKDSHLSDNQIEASLVKDSQTVVDQMQTDSSPVTAAKPNDNQRQLSQTDTAESELEVPNQIDFVGTKADQSLDMKENCLEISQTEEESDVRKEDLPNNGQAVTTSVDQDLLQEEATSDHSQQSETITSEGIVTSETLVIQKNEAIVTHSTITSVDKELDKVESMVRDANTVSHQIMESSQVVEFPSTDTAATSDDNTSQIPGSVYSQSSDTDFQQEAESVYPQSSDTDFQQEAESVYPQSSDTDFQQEAESVYPQSSDTDFQQEAQSVYPQSSDTDFQQEAESVYPQSSDTAFQHEAESVYPQSSDTDFQQEAESVYPQSSDTDFQHEAESVYSQSTDTDFQQETESVYPQSSETDFQQEAESVYSQSTNTNLQQKGESKPSMEMNDSETMETSS